MINTLKSNCHTHTDNCDGRSPAFETVKSAYELGFVSLGFSGHSPLPYESGYAMTDETLQKYISEINSLKNEYRGKMEILLGIEWDNDSDRKYLEGMEYVIGSVHQLHGDKIYPVDCSAEISTECVEKVFGGSWLKMAEKYYELVLWTALIPQVDIVGHFDLITKFNTVSHLFDENDAEYQALAIKCVDDILDKRPEIVFEVNTGAMNRAGKSGPYPAPFILKHMHERGARITVTSDCHSADSLDFSFDKALDECRAAGYEYVYILRKGGFEKVSIL